LFVIQEEKTVAKKVLTDLDFNSASRALNLPAPQDPSEPARLADLNAAIEGLAHKDNARVATQGNIDLFSPGSTIDGIAMSAGDRVLVKSQTDPAENGLYLWNGAAVAMTRTADANTSDELENAIVPVDEGTNEGTVWRQVSVNFAIGTDDIIWVQFGTASAPASESSAGIAELATQAETDTGTDDQRFVTPAKLAGWSGRSRRHHANIGDGSATQFTVTHNLATRDVEVTVFRNAAPYDDVLVDVERDTVNSVVIRFKDAPMANQFRVRVVA
jgi:hypothetical protein